MTTQETVSARLDAELRKRGMSRAQLAHAAGRTPAWLTKKMQGQRRWSVDDLDVLAWALELAPSVLVKQDHRDAQVRAERDRRRLGRVYVELLEERAR